MITPLGIIKVTFSYFNECVVFHPLEQEKAINQRKCNLYVPFEFVLKRSQKVVRVHCDLIWPKPLTWVWRFLCWFVAWFVWYFFEYPLFSSSREDAVKKSLISIAHTGGTSCDRDILVEHSISVRILIYLEKGKYGYFSKKKWKEKMVNFKPSHPVEIATI